MNYTSIVFLYFFLPGFMGIYALAGTGMRGFVMSAGSCAVIAWASPAALIPMGVTVLLSYFSGILIYNLRERRRAANTIVTVFSLAEIAGVICFYLFGKGSESLGGAVGIGLIALHSISYAADVKLGRVQPETRFFTLFAYICFLPSLCGIPFVRYEKLAWQLKKPMLNSAMISDGILLMLLGMAEKVIISDRLTELFKDMQTAASGDMSLIMSWMGAFVFGAGIYISLKGYSNIARGFALMLGFRIGPSFDSPYSKHTVRDYIFSFNTSATEAVRSYVYEPVISVTGSHAFELLASSCSVILVCISYDLSLNYLLWGTAAALLLLGEKLAEKKLSKIPAAVRYIFTHMLTLIGWALISQSTVVGSLDYIRRMFSGAMQIDSKPLLYFLGNAVPYFLIILIFELPFLRSFYFALEKKKPAAVSAFKPFAIFALLFLCTSFLMSGTMINSRIL